jgi:SNF2 family DNA or RNA helicase
MKRTDRTGAIVSFQSDPQTVVMLVSIKAGGVGLNLTAASNVFVFEPAWNPAIEQQAIDRVHRLGQASTVEVVRYIIKGIRPPRRLTLDSIEENMVQLQQKKKELADLVNKKQTKESLSTDRLKDLRMLFA